MFALYLTLLIPSALAWLPGSPRWLNTTSPFQNTTTPWTNTTSPPHYSNNTTPPAPWKMRGVSLGSLFVIEPWMAYDEFTSMGCSTQPDEWSCVQALDQQAADAAFATHWSTWITYEDILEIASFNLNTVRIPIGFWINEALIQESESYPRGALPFLDQIVNWCADQGLYVIIDLHAAPGVQTPNQQFTGHSVSEPGFYTPSNYERAFQFLEWMTERIHTLPAYRNVGMLEVMNEPVQSWNYPAQAADMLNNFYPEALRRIRAAEQDLSVAPCDQLHVQYMASAWASGDPTTYLPTTDPFLAFDDHRYIKWDPSVTATKPGYLVAACNDDRGPANTFIGEWSIAVADDLTSSPDFTIANASPAQLQWYRQFWATQAAAYERSGGWVFWSWKCSWIGGADEWRWCYQSAVAAGVIPRDAGEAGVIAAEVCQAPSGRDGMTMPTTTAPPALEPTVAWPYTPPTPTPTPTQRQYRRKPRRKM